MSERITLVSDNEVLPPEVPVRVMSVSGLVVEVMPVATIIKAAPMVETLSDTSTCCSGCPDRVEYPPSESYCRFFDTTYGTHPVCTRDDSSDNQLRSWLED